MKMRLMRTFLSVIQLFALNGAIHALEIADYPSSGVQTGQTYTILYNPRTNDLVDFSLMKGPATEIAYFRLLGSAQNGMFKWTVSHDLPEGKDYALQIKMDTIENYSGLFSITKASNGSFSSSSLTTPSTASSTLASTTSTTGRDLSEGSQQGGLNKAAKAGIGISSAIAGIGILLAAFLLGKRIYKTSTRTGDTESDPGWVKPELDGKAAYRHEYMAELDGNAGLQEMRTDADAKELIGPLGHERAELSAESKLFEIDSKSAQQLNEDSQQDSQGNKHES